MRVIAERSTRRLISTASSRGVHARSTPRAVLRYRVRMCYRIKVRIRKTAHAASCFTAHASKLHMHCMSRLHAHAATPIPSRGFGGHINITQRGLCAAHCRVLVALTRRIICVMCECPRLHPCNQYVAAHPCASSVDPRPPTSLPAFALTALRAHCTQLIPLPQWGSLFSRSRSTRFTLCCRAHAVRAREERRSQLALKASTVLAASRASKRSKTTALDAAPLDALGNGQQRSP